MGKLKKVDNQSKRPKPIQPKKNLSPTSHISVIEEDAPPPHCEHHGSALLFRETFDDGRPPATFHGCSANRDRNQCRILRTPIADDQQLSAAYEHRVLTNTQLLQLVRAQPAAERAYCGQCGRLVLAADRQAHSGHTPPHWRGISDEQLDNPTRLLAPLSNDSREAQYFFADDTLRTIERWLLAASIERVVCIGAPRLHEYLRSQHDRLRIDSVLLDLDERLEAFYGRDEFYRFNMFNGWWADGEQRSDEFDRFLLDGGHRSTLLFTDPPFGCRTEPLARTLNALQRRYASLHDRKLPAPPLPIMWIFPYFMAAYVQRSMPQLAASEYAVNYTNHRAYHGGDGGRQQGSPVRVFTNVPTLLWATTVSAEEDASAAYVACTPCDGRWRAAGTQHCRRCGECASLNGAAYRHCDRCETCVKPTYVHCERCGRCVQRSGHVCDAYRACVRCWVCRRQGHVERQCAEWLGSVAAGRRVWQKWCKVAKIAGKGEPGGLEVGEEPKRRMCLVCGRLGHNERRCGKRAALLDEWQFAGEVYNRFNVDEIAK